MAHGSTEVRAGSVDLTQAALAMDEKDLMPSGQEATKHHERTPSCLTLLWLPLPT